MGAMGDASAEVWADELRRTGRVVFPLRPRAMASKVGWFAFPCVTTAVSFPGIHEEGGVARLVADLIVIFLIGCVGYLVWQAITRRPRLTVDREGIRFGRRFMPWTDVGAIGITHGPGFYQTLPIIPADVWAKDLFLHQDNVRDIVAFSHWLEEVLKEQRQMATRLPPGRND